VTDPDLYQPLLRPGPAKLPKYTAPYRMFEVFTNPERANILTSPEHATWKAVRQAAVAALTMNNLRHVGRWCAPFVSLKPQQPSHQLLHPCLLVSTLFASLYSTTHTIPRKPNTAGCVCS